MPETTASSKRTATNSIAGLVHGYAQNGKRNVTTSVVVDVDCNEEDGEEEVDGVHRQETGREVYCVLSTQISDDVYNRQLN